MNIAILRDINDWWVAGRVQNSFIEPVPRKIMTDILHTMEERQIILLEGARRVGKTSIIFHIIQNLIGQGIDPQQIIYVSLDDPLIQKEKFFENLIEIIETHLIAGRIQTIRKKIYLFLDEVAHLKDWEFYLKRYYDQKYPFKFIVSSSAASFLVRKGRESLVGRLFRFRIPPFSFSEFLHLRTGRHEIMDISRKAGIIWSDFFETGERDTLFNNLKKLAKNTALYSKEIDIYIRQYLLNGGFPEFLQLKGEREIRQYFPENVIERVVYHDIPEAFKAADRGLLQNLLLYSIFHSGSIININEIAAAYNATRQTVSDYLYYLQASMLIRLLEKYAKTESSRLRAFRKIYTVDTGLYVHLQRLSPTQIEEKGIIGQLAEIAVFSQLSSYHGVPERLFYYRERDMEVDFVIDDAKSPLCVEVKFRTSPEDIKAVGYFMERFKAKTALVITKDAFKIDGNFLFVPMRIFLG